MKKIKIMFMLLLIFCCSYSKTTLNFSEHLAVIYKNLDPLGINVTTPGRLTVKADKGTFKYSDTVADRKALEVIITVPFNTTASIDPLRDTLFRSVRMSLHGNLPDDGEFGGRFSLSSADGNTMEARGFFVESGKSVYDAPLNFISSATKYSGKTKIDVLFNTEKNPKMLKGVYKGVLILEATYNNVSVGG